MKIIFNHLILHICVILKYQCYSKQEKSFTLVYEYNMVNGKCKYLNKKPKKLSYYVNIKWREFVACKYDKVQMRQYCDTQVNTVQYICAKCGE